ncbi:MAG: NTP transferase domain-containing protein [Methanobacteriaceae archaeon]
MAGGKGTRMGNNIEKPLVKLNDIPIINYVINNMANSVFVDEIIIATSPNTNKTHEYFHNKNSKNKEIMGNISTIKTPGNGYINDLGFLLDFFENISNEDILVFINADLPLVKSEIIDFAIDEYINIVNNHDSSVESVSIMVPIDIYTKNDLTPSFEFEGLVPSGLNILTSKNKVQIEEQLIIPKLELALNINTEKDLEIASKIAKFI